MQNTMTQVNRVNTLQQKVDLACKEWQQNKNKGTLSDKLLAKWQAASVAYEKALDKLLAEGC